MRPRDLGDLLLRKAAQDEFVLERLAPDPATPHEVLGFHGQQAVEKMLKAALASRAVRYRYTHDLVELIDLLRLHGTPLPADLEQVARLSPYAVAFRYDDLPDELEEPLDSAWVLQCVRQVRDWADSVVRGATDASSG